MLSKFQNNPDIATWILRLGLVFIFAYAGIDGLRHPLLWVGYMPKFLLDTFDQTVLMRFFSIVELLLALWLLVGVYLRWAALLAAAMLAGITLSNLPNFLITFRDVGLFAMALALAVLAKE
ncbi:MAG TPA: MauE/DoxX family redox-associated membrane protein [Candidatus Saccharimonadales bacterium]|nr:MauE/DoxX family redox-associated membrane protein [Candidatus Saccharimonadales bacterium]